MDEEKQLNICLWCNSGYENRPGNGVCPKCGYSQLGKFNVKMGDISNAVIIKFGDLTTLESMRGGNVWFQSPKYYQEYRGNSAICDISECAYDFIMDVPTEFLKKHLPACGNIIIADGREFVLKEIKGAKAYVYSNTQNYNRLLCFYRLKTDQGLLLERDQRLKSFGSHFCLVDSKKFIQRVDNYAKANNLFFSPVYVKYATEAYRGAYNPTFKGDAFSYQNEFRFILRGESLNKLPERKPLKLRIDGMDEIMTEPQPMEKLFEMQALEDLFSLFGLTE